MRATLVPEERLGLCRLLLNRTGWRGCPSKQRKDAVDAVFELTSTGQIRVEWLKLVEKRCGLFEGELDYYTGIIEYRTKD